MNYLDKLELLYEPNIPNMRLGLLDSIPQNLIKAKDVSIPNAQILKYNPATTMFKGNWNQYTVNGARGHIVDKDTFEPINMPFPKLFEASELDIVVPPDTPVLAFRKRNGFMLSVTWYNDELVVATTGTIDSDYAKLGRSYITPRLESVFKRFYTLTFLFEVCDPSDPHIFPETQGLYLIGIRQNHWGSHPNFLIQHLDYIKQIFGNALEDIKFDPPELSTYGEIQERSMIEDCEGYVVWIKNRYPLKLKCQHYKIRKKLARAKGERLKAVLNDDKLYTDRNYIKLRDVIRDSYNQFLTMQEQERLELLTKTIDSIREDNEF